jgi:serine/threonine protein kinase/formylglycine-generating enzyme required for sulfatase activity
VRVPRPDRDVGDARSGGPGGDPDDPPDDADRCRRVRVVALRERDGARWDRESNERAGARCVEREDELLTVEEGRRVDPFFVDLVDLDAKPADRLPRVAGERRQVELREHVALADETTALEDQHAPARVERSGEARTRVQQKGFAPPRGPQQVGQERLVRRGIVQTDEQEARSVEQGAREFRPAHLLATELARRAGEQRFEFEDLDHLLETGRRDSSVSGAVQERQPPPPGSRAPPKRVEHGAPHNRSRIGIEERDATTLGSDRDPGSTVEQHAVVEDDAARGGDDPGDRSQQQRSVGDRRRDDPGGRLVDHDGEVERAFLAVRTLSGHVDPQVEFEARQRGAPSNAWPTPCIGARGARRARSAARVVRSSRRRAPRLRSSASPVTTRLAFRLTRRTVPVNAVRDRSDAHAPRRAPGLDRAHTTARPPALPLERRVRFNQGSPMGRSDATPRPAADHPSLPDALEDELLAILEGPAPARAEALERLCAAHPDHEASLRHWLDAALGRAASLPGLFDLESARSGSLSGAATPTGGLHPDRVGTYRILDVLGEGGMGVVYLAEQSEGLRRRVALKVIRAGMDSRQLLRRFQAESRALALMEHHAIARIYDVGTTDDGRPFFAMEYVDGLPLTTFCDSQRLGIRARLELLEQVCDGVQHAHDKGVVHRDLKPSNVLVALRDGRPVPKIIDFGLVRALEIDLVDSTLLTMRGALLGTPGYMSPEQAGAFGPTEVDARADVYSLGAMLYELLVGRVPLDGGGLGGPDGATWRNGGLLELRRLLRTREVDRPSVYLRRNWDQIGPVAHARSTNRRGLLRRVRGDLDLITKKALARDRELRYPRPADLGRDLRQHLDHEPIAAAGPALSYRLSRLARRHAPAALLVAFVLTAVGAAFAFVLDAERRTQALRRELVRAEREAEQELGRTHDELTLQRARANRQDARATELADRLERAERELAAIDLAAVVAEVGELERGIDDLWPAWPENLDRLRAWRSRARNAVTKLAELRAVRTELAGRLGDLDPSTARRVAWLCERLDEAIVTLEDFAFREDAPISAIERRIEHAQRIEAETVEAFAGSWRAAADRVRADARFRGFELAPQLGLEPLGPDPHTGLEEFLHVASADRRAPYPVERRVQANTGLILVLVPPGDVTLRDPIGGTSHTIALDPFFIAKFEMTRGQWRRLGGEEIAESAPGDLAAPAVGVSWRAFEALLRRYALSLPSRAQWLYAARGGRETDARFWSGDDSASLRDRANLDDPSMPDRVPGLGPVGTFAERDGNGFGLLDVHGNAAEWVLDAPSATTTPRGGDGRRSASEGDTTLRLVLGGSFRDPAMRAALDRFAACLFDAGRDDVGCRPVRAVR